MTSTLRRSAWGLSIGPLVVLALLIGLLAFAEPAEAAYPGANGKIAFYGHDACCPSSIHAVELDGTGQTELVASGARNPAWSKEGDKIAFDVAGADIYIANADGSGQRRVTSGRHPAWWYVTASPGLAFEDGSVWTGISIVDLDGTNKRVVTSGRPCSEGQDGWYYRDPATDLSGNIFFSKTLVNWDADLGQCVTGSTTIGWVYYKSPEGEHILTSGPDDRSPDDAPSPFRVVFSRSGELWVIDRGTLIDLNVQGLEPAWSPDGRKIVFSRVLADGQSDLFTVNSDGSGETRLTDNPAYGDLGADWQARNPAPYTRPIGTALSRLSLGPTFRPCAPGSTNASHGSALAGASCNPPIPSSAQVAVGPRSLGYTQWRALAMGQCAGFDSTRCYPDVAIRFNITDVRSGTPSGPDYDSDMVNWDLTGSATLPNTGHGSVVLTDMYSASNPPFFEAYDKSATSQPFGPPYPPLRIPIDCVPTSDTSVGSVCNVQTTVNTLMAGVAVAGKRAIWELGQLQVLDQGGDGVPGDNDDQLFEAQGVFLP